jgi:sterol 3beta-glucosyltransferase
MVHEATAIPYVSVHFSPLGMLGAEEVRTVSSALINKVRVKEGFLPLHDPLGKDGASDQLALFAVSRHLLLKPREWPGHYRIVGFFFLEEREWRPDPVLAAFCSGNNPFVVVGFGSVMHSNPETVADLIMQAIDHAKCRAVVQRGWSGLSFSTTPPNVCCVDFVPHSWIFARAALVVHHGGAGTSAAAFRAGVPTVVVPHTLDQPIWAELARSKGCSRSVIPFPQLSVHRLASAIKLSVNNPSLISAAKEFARLVQAEEGVREARRLIEEVLASRSQA